MHSEFGLIGKKLSHSFSKKYFEEKFRDLNLQDHYYHLFEIESVQEIKNIIEKHPELKGLNVTIPFKNDVIKILNEIEVNADRIGSVNVIKITNRGKLKGFNTDYYGFHESLKKWLDTTHISDLSALVLGSGGASKAVCCVLEDLNIRCQVVSRKNNDSGLTYLDLEKNIDYIRANPLIINTTPLGMFPETDSYPPLDYTQITPKHFIYDLVYNPEETLFLKKSREQGARIRNGLEMLHLQAEKSWEIWSE